jgi:hypothetical protein
MQLESLAGTLYPEAPAESRKTITAWAFAQTDARVRREAASWLQDGISGMRRRAEAIPASEMELARLEEVVRKDRELLQSFRAQMVSSDVSQALETTNLGMRVEIVDPAQTPLAPSRPNRTRILLAAFLVGPLAGVVFAVAAEILDPTLRTLEDIRRVAPEPVFGTLPLLTALAPRNRGLRRYWVPATVGGIVLLTAVFFVARTTVLENLGTGAPVRVVDPGEGTTP